MLRFQMNERSVVRNRIRRALIGATGILALTAVTGLLVLPEITLAGKGGKGGGGGTKGGTNTPLCLEFRDFSGDPFLPPDAIQSDFFDLDGDGVTDPYCDGVDKVEAKLVNLEGNLAFGTGGGIRTRFIDVTACIDCPEGEVLPFGFFGGYIATNRDTDLRTLTAGVPTPVGLRIMFNTNPDSTGKKGLDTWNIIFGDNNAKFPCDVNDRVTVTAFDLDADGVNDVWTIEAFPEDVACLFHKDDPIRHISAPFLLIATRQ